MIGGQIQGTTNRGEARLPRFLFALIPETWRPVGLVDCLNS
jgi:hypothetical protein